MLMLHFPLRVIKVSSQTTVRKPLVSATLKRGVEREKGLVNIEFVYYVWIANSMYEGADCKLASMTSFRTSALNLHCAKPEELGTKII